MNPNKLTPIKVPSPSQKFSPINVSFDGEEIPPKQLPNPTGYKILLAPIAIDDTTAGGIILAREEQKAQQAIRFIAKVLKLGPLCYKDNKFKPHPEANAEPWCKVGDIVSIGQYAGSRIPCINADGYSFELKLINDDEVNCVIPDMEVIDV